MGEVELRNETYLKAIDSLCVAKHLAMSLVEYPEMNVLVIEIDEAIDGIKDRLLSIAKTTDKNMMIRIHQLDLKTTS